MIEIKNVDDLNPYALADGMPIEGKLKEYHQFEQARAQLKFSLLTPEEKKVQREANKHMAKKMGGF